MSKKLQQIISLKEVADMHYAAKQAVFQAARTRENVLRDQIRELVAERSEVTHTRRDLDDTALKAGADLRWQRWVDARQETLNRELAQARAQVIIARDALRQAFGRKEALSLLAQAEQDKSLQLRTRRGAYES